MPFEQILKKMTRQVDGAIGAIFVDREGEAIAYDAGRSGEEIKLMGASYGIVWFEIEALMGRTAGLRPTEIVISSERGICLMKPLQKDYFLFLVFNPAGNLGQARRWMGWAIEEIQREM